MKKTLMTAAFCVFCVLFLLSADSDGVSGSWAWSTFTDASEKGSSTCNMKEAQETVGGGAYTTYTVSGEITNKYQYGFAGWVAVPDAGTLAALKTAKSFSFKVLGDGQSYFVMLCTSDIKDAAYYRTTFNTQKGVVTTVTVDVKSLAQPKDWGVKRKFNQSAATQVQWQTTNNGKPGTFNLKLFDLKLYP